MRSMFVPSIFRHVQVDPADVWVINHNLGNNGSTGLPVVDTFVQDNGADEKIIPMAVTVINANTVQVTFSYPRSGFAVVIV